MGEVGGVGVGFLLSSIHIFTSFLNLGRLQQLLVSSGSWFHSCTPLHLQLLLVDSSLALLVTRLLSSSKWILSLSCAGIPSLTVFQ